MADMTDIDNRFNFYMQRKGQSHAEIRLECKKLAVLITNRTPASREQSLAITKIEEAMFWANAAIVRSQTT